MPRPAPQAIRHRRPSYLAPPPLLLESEPFEGAALLQEQPGPLGVVLWKSLRDVSLWTSAGPEERPTLFVPSAAGARGAEIAEAATPELWAPLLVIAHVLAEPVRVDERRLVHACRTIADWGRRQGATAVQLAFTQAAARLVPDEPRLAYAVGRLARDRGEYARGESWLRASISLSRNQDWHTYALGYLSLGSLYQMIGNLPAARVVTVRGYRTASRRRLRPLRGTALHNLFSIAGEMLDFRRAHKYALLAFRQYGPDHERFPALVQDVACFWILHGCFDLAVRAFHSVLPRFTAGEDRMLVLANLARAAAAAGHTTLYLAARAESAALMSFPQRPEREAQVWLNLARADATAGLTEQAEAALGRAEVLADQLRLGLMRFEAEALRGAIQSARMQSARVEAATGTPGLRDEAEQLATAILESLAPSTRMSGAGA
ncbi:MAG TPA: hypothetical protein VF665_14555 [Longimicrobium sp.]|jgi:tetratricopeptide (TPR) repeat protein|uniref:hypothetical protein n=1 Tax=Longimicrobium sp. TaxID=2029185 RepID=UPI002ED9B178